MKKINLIYTILIVIIATFPFLFFNFNVKEKSFMTNKLLTTFPSSYEQFVSPNEGGFESYLMDRLGFHDDTVTTFMNMDDKLFNKLSHPIYEYGKDGYIFAKMVRDDVDVNYLNLFVYYIAYIQSYCEDRGIPFLFYLSPEKSTIYSQYLPYGYNYLNSDLAYLKQKLDEVGIQYIDNVDLLKEKSKNEQVYNIKYDAGHWNELGAYYGSNNLLAKINERMPEVETNNLNDFKIYQKTEKNLLLSNFIINEKVPFFEMVQDDTERNTDFDTNLQISKQYPEFIRYEHKNKGDSLPSLLMFNGSYFQSDRIKFLRNHFSETTSIHNYQNVINFDYYYNIFKPDYVVFESAEYTILNYYFDYTGMSIKRLNPSYDTYDKIKPTEVSTPLKLEYEVNGSLTNIVYKDIKNMKYLYLEKDGEIYDFMCKEDGEFKLTVKSEVLKSHDFNIIMIDSSEENKMVYKIFH